MTPLDKVFMLSSEDVLDQVDCLHGSGSTDEQYSQVVRQYTGWQQRG